MNANKLIFKEGILNLIALFTAMCLNFLGILVITKTFSVEDVGLFNAIINATAILSTITVIGINNIFIRVIPGINRDKESEASDLFIYQITKNILVSAICILLIYAFKPFFVNILIKNQLIGTYFYVIPLYIVNTGLQQILGSYLRAWYKTSAQSFIVNTLLKSGNFFLILICLRFRLTVINYIHYYLYLLIAINLVLFYVIAKNRYIKPIKIRNVLKKYLNRNKFIEQDVYGLIMSVSAIASVLAAYADRILVNWFTDNSQLAVYNTAVLIGGTIAIFGNSLAMIGHPLMGKYIGDNNITELDNVYKFTQKWSLIATLPVAVVIVIYSKALLSLLGTARGGEGSVYASGAVVLSIVVIGQLINVGTGMCGGIISFSKHYKMDLYTQIILAVLSITLNAALIPAYGMAGAAVASSSSLAIYNIVKVIYVKIKFGILPFDTGIIKVLAGTVFSVVLTLALNQVIDLDGFYLIAEAGLAVLASYAIVLIAGLSKSDIVKLKQLIVRK
ncbi:MAG: oligosaccharide flippase family protein [Clostridia bacterium]|nr:oligosaccharide flippase family protein [Clostridia bacterium]